MADGDYEQEGSTERRIAAAVRAVSRNWRTELDSATKAITAAELEARQALERVAAVEAELKLLRAELSQLKSRFSG